MEDFSTHRPTGAGTHLLPALMQALATRPQQHVLLWRQRSIRSQQLLYKVQRMTAVLADAGVSRGDVVAVLLPRCPDMLVVLLALWWRGAVYLPLDPQWPDARLEAALETAGASWLVLRSELSALCPRSTCRRLELAEMEFDQTGTSAGSPDLPVPAAATAAELAYLLFTSGSTGTPKAVCVNHSAIACLFHAVLPLLELKPGWRVLGCSAFCFDIVLFEWLAPILSGGCLVLADDSQYRDSGKLTRLIIEAKVDVVQATPSLWRQLLQQLFLQPAHHPEPALALAIATGEALDAATARGLLSCSSVAWNLYGPTECTLWSSACRLNPTVCAAPGSSVAIGQPLPGYDFSLVPECAATGGDTGELLISGAGVACGYLGADAAQKSRFATTDDGRRSFRSGDLCRRDADGNYHFLRRCDRQLKHNGYRIEAGEIEAQLRTHPTIADAACLVRPLASGTQLLACVVCRPGTPNKDRERWNRHLAQWLPAWMLPDRYLVVDALPLDGNGKLDSGELLRLAQPRSVRGAAFPATLQTQVSEVFCAVLELDEIAPCDSFFDLGGNSMLGATLLLALNQRFGTQLQLRDMLKRPPTVQRLCALLQAAGIPA